MESWSSGQGSNDLTRQAEGSQGEGRRLGDRKALLFHTPLPFSKTFLAMHLSSPTRDRTCTPYIGSPEA